MIEYAKLGFASASNEIRRASIRLVYFWIIFTPTFNQPSSPLAYHGKATRSGRAPARAISLWISLTFGALDEWCGTCCYPSITSLQSVAVAKAISLHRLQTPQMDSRVVFICFIKLSSVSSSSAKTSRCRQAIWNINIRISVGTSMAGERGPR